jgi:hypothetical protein
MEIILLDTGVILLIAWLLGFLAFHVMSGLIHGPGCDLVRYLSIRGASNGRLTSPEPPGRSERRARLGAPSFFKGIVGQILSARRQPSAQCRDALGS